MCGGKRDEEERNGGSWLKGKTEWEFEEGEQHWDGGKVKANNGSQHRSHYLEIIDPIQFLNQGYEKVHSPPRTSDSFLDARSRNDLCIAAVFSAYAFFPCLILF